MQDIECHRSRREVLAGAAAVAAASVLPARPRPVAARAPAAVAAPPAAALWPTETLEEYEARTEGWIDQLMSEPGPLTPAEVAALKQKAKERAKPAK